MHSVTLPFTTSAHVTPCRMNDLVHKARKDGIVEEDLQQPSQNSTHEAYEKFTTHWQAELKLKVGPLPCFLPLTAFPNHILMWT